jgi:CheY-like chemotaxis protein
MKILVIEDEKNIRENILEILEIKGHEIQVACDGREGLVVYETFKPEFILCDIMVPHMDGYTFVKTIRSAPIFSQVPVVFISAKAEREEYEKAIAIGASDFLTKPFSFDELFEVINKFNK